ncbi:acetolactate synthase large subunit [Ruminococcus callidus]|nr:acetolactate synthase large subunit [Ruminococcus callidus]MCB5776181.1 acetolactate synthase large subunit [Ruminococcus callidus]MCC2759876.1 acetolactate synthase large subunit [Ruminococcus callidus]
MKKDSPTMTAAELLVRCLENEGVKYIFGIPGEENLDVMQALRNSSIQFITTRHEQGAAFMADVYGRLTGKAGVCLSTLGPGATNLVTGVADANSDGAPLVAITGQVDTNRMHITSHQFLDLVQMFTPITKRSKQIVRPDSINEIVRIAFKYAESEKPGAAHIDLPNDIAKLPVPEDPNVMPMRHTAVHQELTGVADVEKAAGLIFQAEHPVILAGHSAVRAHAAEALTKFAEQLKIPVINTMMAKGIIPMDNRYSMGTMGIPQRDFQNVMLDNSDLVIAVGYDIVEFSPSKWNRTQNHKIIHLDVRPAHIHSLYQPQVQVVGDISDSLEKIAVRCHRENEPELFFRLKELMLEDYSAAESDDGFPIKPQRVLHDIRQVLGQEDILISDVGAHKMWIGRQYNCYHPNTCIISNGFASMGISVPGAIAAKLIYPEKKVLAVSGDGGFMMNCQEMETALRIGVPIVVMIFNDSGYGLIRWKQEDHFGSSCFTDFTNPDFVKFAESMGAKGYRIQSAEEIIPVMEDAFSQNVPCIIDCPIDYSENTRLSERLQKMDAWIAERL